jgi:hypothetical protein
MQTPCLYNERTTPVATPAPAPLLAQEVLEFLETADSQQAVKALNPDFEMDGRFFYEEASGFRIFVFFVTVHVH